MTIYWTSGTNRHWMKVFRNPLLNLSIFLLASSGKKVGENPQNEISHGASTKSYCHQLPQPTVDMGNNHDTDSDQGTELAENFPVHLTVSDLEVEISAGSSEGSGSQPVKEMPTGDPKPVSPRGAGLVCLWFVFSTTFSLNAYDSIANREHYFCKKRNE